MGPGENAGVVDVGDGLAAAFKVESHNHPSAVEPFQGAATGVGGILRDIFAVGARPIAVLDSLRFGELDSPRSRYLFDWAVKGIGHYGNSIGVPTVGGEVMFEAAYEQNCLVNAMCVGLAPARSADPERGRRGGQRGRAARRPHRAATGSAAPRCWRAPSSRRRTRRSGRACRSAIPSRSRSWSSAASSCSSGPAALAAGPRRRRALLLVVGDGVEGRGGARHRRLAGAAARGRHGALRDHDLGVAGADAVRGRARAARGRARRVRALGGARHADRRGHRHAPAAGVRRRRAGGRHAGRGARGRLPALRPRAGGARGADLPGPAGAPRGGPARRRTLLALLGSAEHGLQALRLRAVRPDRGLAHGAPAAGGGRRGADAPVDGGSGAIAVSIDGNGRRVACDPYTGAVEAVLECARNLACVGAEPLGLTNCLNFGNPEKPHIAWQLTRAVEGLRDACLALGVPVVGGNVSLYNEGGGGPIYPTPIVGMVGKLPDPRACRARASRSQGHAVALVGPLPCARGDRAREAARRLARRLLPTGPGRAGRGLAALREAVRGARSRGHDISEGGLAVALAECCIDGAGWGAYWTPAARTTRPSVRRGPGRRRDRRPARGVRDRRCRRDRRGGRRPSRSGACLLSVERLRGYEGAIRRVRRARSSSRQPRGADAGPAGTSSRGRDLAAGSPRGPRVDRMNQELDDRDGPRDECGVFGVYAPDQDVARLAYFALYALQHRGQESAGIATSESGQIMTVRDLGLVSQVFDEEKLRALHRADGGRPRALLHDRLLGVGERPAGLAHGPPPGGARPQRQPHQRGRAARRAERPRRPLPRHLRLRDHRGDALDPRGRAGRGRARGCRAAPRGRLLDGRDDEGGGGRLPRPRGPAAARARDDRGDRCVASESCAFDIIGAELLREVQPGEMVSLGERGIETRQLVESERRRSASSSTSTSLAPTRSSRETARRCRAARWARSSGARRPWTRTS